MPLHSSSRPWFKLNAKCTLIWKEDFGPLNNSPVLFLLSPDKMLLTTFLFQKWLGSPFPEDVGAWWLLMHWLQLQFTVHSLWSSPKCLNQLCLTVFSSLRSSLLLVHHFLPNFYLPVHFAYIYMRVCIMLWCRTLWPATPLTLCDLSSLWRVSMIVFWTIAKSAVFPIIVVSKNKRYPQFILYGWSFNETQM